MFISKFKNNHYWLFSILILLFILASKPSLAATTASSQSLFTLSSTPDLKSTAKDLSTIQAVPISLNTQFLAQFPSTMAAVSANKLSNSQLAALDFQLNLFGQVLPVSVTRLEPASVGSLAIIGKIKDDPLSSVVLIKRGDILQGNIIYKLRTFQIRSLPKKLQRTIEGKQFNHILQETDPSKLPPDHLPGEIPDESRAIDHLNDNHESALKTASDDGSIIDVLVMYTKAAREELGEVNDMEALIDLAIIETNEGYANSDVKHRLRLIHRAEIDYTVVDRTLSKPLKELARTNDGIMDNVHKLRDEYRADLVTLLVRVPPTPTTQKAVCGRGYLNVEASKGFSVTDYRCATGPGKYTFAHELGHNFGAQHDRAQIIKGGNNPGAGYNFGYINTTEGWRTMMAYNDNINCPLKLCTRLNYWSNPNILHDDQPMGVADINNGADNHRQLNTTAQRIANYRVSRPAPTLIAPKGNIASTTPTYQWQAVHYANWYQLIVNDRSGKRIEAWYTATSLGCAEGQGICKVTPNISVAGFGTWWVEANNNINGYSALSEPLSFNLVSLPGVVSLLAPEGDLGLNRPNYRWQALTDVDSYELSVKNALGQVLTQRYSPEQAACLDSLLVCSVTPNLTLASANYSWSIRAINAAGIGAWSPAKNFTASTPRPPLAANLLAPIGTIANNKPVFTWKTVKAATHYRLKVGNIIDTTLSFEAAGCPPENTTQICQYTSPFAIQDTNTITWSVQASNSAGAGALASQTFKILGAGSPPTAPQLIWPIGAVEANSFEWSDVSNAEQYKLWVAKKSTGILLLETTYNKNQLTEHTNRNSWSIPSSLSFTEGEEYLWKMQAINTNGTSPWSQTASFSFARIE